ncbi:Mov34/MPN/PAD-1 family protein [Vreelandella malpeensis]|uniref:C40 family peptidase n=1 Tax=Vreelandella malpeensis TaxID=1172368 RepID=A0ABS8DUB4_9GAMM|nr:Mov34/MPN/PAD-1 family protein [Halomonas malpeensis]MCB8889922.1 C40 family peptidase [Halomonas malpeensis]
MFDQYAEEIRAAALEAYPLEAVWLITADGCRQVPNVADDPAATFRVASRDMAAAQAAGLLAVVHSHPDYPDCPSEADMRGQQTSGMPWGIVATDGEQTTPIRWWGVEGAERAPLVGRGFVHGIHDCYGLIRDYYAEELDVVLPDVPRSWEWWLAGQDLYQDGFAAAGFRRISAEEARPGDMWLAQLRSPVPSHGGVLLEHGLALHHPCGRFAVDPSRLSVREPLGRWLPYITHWMRHTSQDP